MKLGFNISITDKSPETVISEIEEYSKVSKEAIELSFVKLKGILDFPFEKITPYFKRFKYISIHLPVITGENPENNEFLVYPNSKLNKHIDIIKNIADELQVKTYVLHPDQVTDFNWAQKTFGELLGFENMDSRKNFGKTPEDMKKVFKMCPDAKWIFDVNHLYTNDPKMKTAPMFFEIFKNRLTHYHVSAFGGFHNSFYKNPKELIILSGVIDPSYPMIHEGYKVKDCNIQEEYDLIEKILIKNHIR